MGCVVGGVGYGSEFVGLAVASPAAGAADLNMEISDKAASWDAMAWAGEMTVAALSKDE